MMKKDTIIQIMLFIVCIIIVLYVGKIAIETTDRQINEFCNSTNWTGYANEGDMTVNCTRILIITKNINKGDT